ncbi:hypothetical protein EBE87_19380 [Pseudoroseomonas wenyumeiae]|uniref:Uncharacterized protein n=1 Tax=Teichococcus wenyumeiae TaxID=2478470 RepID=A0A3A9JNP1_9PROT|nr:hypothetical protein [Pseudoroseomonas wenyumeiae]RKK05424.1 hypothetical protein D6Z83_04245 [Pseudoroseomonas wenyumeiae]RMI19639.1 hypothetical protein EBE87_19380 [Pseudoroseomonas wenyumeiae]
MQVVDLSTAQDVLGGLPASIVSVVLNGFELDVRRLNKDMLRAAHAGDAVAYSNAAHALADAASRLGATELAVMARGASRRPVPVADLSLLVASESAIGEMRAAFRG